MITIAEMVKGFQKLGQEDRIAGLRAAIYTEDILPVDLEAAVLGGRIMGELERKGLSIGRIDPFIAGIALARNITLATGNTKHFQRIVDAGFALKLDDWRQE